MKLWFLYRKTYIIFTQYGPRVKIQVAVEILNNEGDKINVRE